ncbi:MAG TPA: metal-dependent transcriptional regulator [Flavisolibacter sp.]|nr:metal-dependent transcriptional regulator [Flavisolibacter sp.]
MPHFTHHYEENYLKALYKLSNKELEKVNNIALAKHMELNPATVLEMVRKMVEKGLVQLLPDKSIQLTEKGKKNAILIIRKHRLWEVFLVDKLNYKWNEVHELAEQLEHIESNNLIDRLEKFLGYPVCDPHGDPIPDKNGKIKSNISVPLSSVLQGKSYIITNFGDTKDSFLEYLEKNNLKPGSKIKLIEQNEYDKSTTISINKKTINVSEKVAQNLLVRPI